MVVDVKNVAIKFKVGDFRNIGLKEYLAQKITGKYDAKDFWAVDDVSFQLDKGDFLGIVGTNGAGKTTLLKAVSGVIKPHKGEIHTEGQISALLALGTGFDDDLTVKENIYLRGAFLGYTEAFMNEKYPEIMEFSELQEFEGYRLRQLSSGMRSRMAFSIASLIDPEILILDEVLAVGDGAFRKKSEAKMMEIIKNGTTTLFVSHSISQVRKLCNKVLWLDKGKQIAFTDNRKDTLDLLNIYETYLKKLSTDPYMDINISELRKASSKNSNSKKTSGKSDTISVAKYNQLMKNSGNKEARYKMYIDFMSDIIIHSEKVQYMRKYMKKRNIKHIALYGETAVLKTIVPLLKSENIIIDYMIENAKKSAYCEKVYNRDTKMFPKTQLILITDMFFSDRIRKKLKEITKIPCCTLQELFSKE